ncbi:MAG TPA: tetratricopeptide repeat protein, partial [Xanthomonadaceae bacterium]|nr:tetratricopeptide repeat protein [Xanthomonadaceae bacterium]
LALRRGNEAAAGRELQALARATGKDADEGWRHAFGVLLGGGKDSKATTRLLTTLLDSGAIPNRLQAWLAFGGLAQRLDQDALAERIVSEVVRRFPGEPRVALLHVSQLRESGQREQARKALDGLLGRADSDAELRLAIAAEYEALGDFPAAAAVLARGPQDAQSYALRASMLARAKDTPTLQRLYDELRRDSARPDPERRLLLGQVAEFLELHEQALTWYRSVPGGEQRVQAQLREASVLHTLKRRDEAYVQVRQLQDDAAADQESRRDAYALEAELRLRDKDAAAELDAYARGLAAFPDDPGLLYARALVWERRDDIARAEADLRKILVAQPDSVTALNALGYTLADRTTRYAEALELIARARTADPDSAAIIDSYGWVLYRLGRSQEAIVELRRAYALQKDAEIAAHLGEVLWRAGERVEARKFFEEARALDPDSRALQRALANTGQ